MQVLEDLYLGDVRPSDRSFKRNSQYAKALDELVKVGDALTDSLTEEQKEHFEDYTTVRREVNVLTDRETLRGCVRSWWRRSLTEDLRPFFWAMDALMLQIARRSRVSYSR